MKVCVFLSIFTTVIGSYPLWCDGAAHHIPEHVGSSEAVLLVVPGVPVSVQGDGEGYVVRDWDGFQGHGIPGVLVPGTRVQGSLIVAPELPGAKLVSGGDLLQHNVRKRATGFSYTASDGTSRSERLETYVDPRVKDGHPLNRVTGRVSYTSPEGVPITVNYVADGSGYHVLP